MKIKQALVNNPLAGYFAIAFVLSWSLMVPLALQSQGLVRSGIPFYFHYLAAFGPFLSALVMTYLTQGASGLRLLGNRMIKWKIGPAWWLVVFSPVLLYLLGFVAIWIVQGVWLDPRALGRVEFLPELGFLAPILWFLTYGIGEETGWRGFALPRLQKKRNALYASLILGLFWAAWHAPAFFYLYDPKIFIGFLIGVLSGSVVFTWIYNSTAGSILAVAIWHGLFNFTTGCIECKSGIISMVLSTLVIIWAIFIIIIYKPENLSKSGRQVE